MIQRVQTLFMLLAVAGMVATFFTPIGAFMADTHHYVLSPYGIKDHLGNDFHSEVGSYYFYIPLTISLVLAIYSIFQFGRRKFQRTLNTLNMVCLAVTIVLVALYLKNVGDTFPDLGVGFGVGFFLPYLSFILLALANRAIKKDDDLVKSVDRIR